MRFGRIRHLTFPGHWESLIGVVVTVGVSLFVTTVPLVSQFWRPRLSLQGGSFTLSRKAVRRRAVLLAAQTATVLALLVGAGLSLGTLANLYQQPLGFSPDRVLAIEFSTRGYTNDSTRYQALLDNLRRTALVPAGRRDVAFTFNPPLTESDLSPAVSLEQGRPVPTISVKSPTGTLQFSVSRF